MPSRASEHLPATFSTPREVICQLGLQVQKMYDIFNTNHFKIMRNLAAVNPNTAPAALPFPMDIEPAEAGQWQEPGSSSQHPNSHPPLPWDAPPKGPKPFGVLHETYSEVRPQRFPSVPHHRVDRVQTEYNTKARKLHDRADDGRNTTVMLANIPDGLIADDCIDSLDQAGFFASYDYFIFRVGNLFCSPADTAFACLIIFHHSQKTYSRTRYKTSCLNTGSKLLHCVQ